MTQTPKRMPQREKRLAFQNGVKTFAKRYGRTWFVGGDRPNKSDNIQIAALHDDFITGTKRWSWMKLKGCFLVFDDYMTDAEVAEQIALAQAQS